jgi:cytoskeletal protein CcmA (bactofilin family)
MWSGKKRETPKAPETKTPAAPPAQAKPAQEAKPVTPSEPPRPAPVANRERAVIGKGLHVQGEISGNEDLQVDGTIEGHVHLGERRLTVGTTAKVTADIQAREVVVFGNVKGNLRARDRIEIKKDGSVVGDLSTARIMIEDGAYFKGSIEIDREAGGRAASPGAQAQPASGSRPSTS